MTTTPPRLMLPAVLPLLLTALLQGCAITVDKHDVFTLRDPHLPVASVVISPEARRAQVSEIALQVDGRRFQGYRLAAAQPTRAVVFFPGSGYGAASALQRVSTVFGDARTDVYMLSYGQPDEAPPDVAQTQAMARALAALAATQSGIAPQRVAAVGHSLGGWFALHLAGTGHIGCAVVVGTGSTISDAAADLMPQALTAVASYRPTPDAALLDNLAQARQSRVPVMVVGSAVDESMPAARSQAVFGQLPAGGAHALHLSPTASHRGYFTETAVNTAIGQFIDSRCGG